MNFEAGVFNNATADANVTGAAVIAVRLSSGEHPSLLTYGKLVTDIKHRLVV